VEPLLCESELSVGLGVCLFVAVYCAAVSVIVRNSTIEARFPGGISTFGLSRPNETLCSDGEISRVGFLVENDARSFIARLLEAGIVPPENEASSEIALIVEGMGFLYPCEWLQIGLFDGRPAAWLASSGRGKLAINRWEFEVSTTPLQRISQEDLRDSYEFLGLKDKVEAYRHKTTGKVLYVGRPFHAMPDRKWWQFWKRP
jgi:hypothetical protein